MGWGGLGREAKQKALLGYVSAITAIIGVCLVQYGSVDSAPSRNLFAHFGLESKFLPDLPQPGPGPRNTIMIRQYIRGNKLENFLYFEKFSKSNDRSIQNYDKMNVSA